METIFIYVFLFLVVVGIMLSVWNDWKAEKHRQAEFEQLKALEASRQAMRIRQPITLWAQETCSSTP